ISTARTSWGPSTSPSPPACGSTTPTSWRRRHEAPRLQAPGRAPRLPARADPGGGPMTACDDCLRRTDLVAALTGRLQIEFKQRNAPSSGLASPDDDLLDVAGTGEVRARYARFKPAVARRDAVDAGLETTCRCRKTYPQRLRDLADPPAVIH